MQEELAQSIESSLVKHGVIVTGVTHNTPEFLHFEIHNLDTCSGLFKSLQEAASRTTTGNQPAPQIGISARTCVLWVRVHPSRRIRWPSKRTRFLVLLIATTVALVKAAVLLLHMVTPKLPPFTDRAYSPLAGILYTALHAIVAFCLTIQGHVAMT